MTTAALAAPGAQDEDRSEAPKELWYNAMAGVIVAGIGLFVLFGVVAMAILTLPNDDTRRRT